MRPAQARERDLVRAFLAIAFHGAPAGAGVPASAQDQGLGGSFITPFPDNDVYQVQVVGDWLAEGLLSGLVEAFTDRAGRVDLAQAR